MIAQNVLSIPEIFDGIERTAERGNNMSAPQKEIGRALEKQYVNHLLKLALNRGIEEQVNGFALARVAELEAKVKNRAASDPSEKAQSAYILSQIDQFQRNPKALDLPTPAKIPDGSPIGTDE